MSDDTARALSMGLVVLTSKSKRANEIKLSTNTDAFKSFDDINTSLFELSTYDLQNNLNAMKQLLVSLKVRITTIEAIMPCARNTNRFELKTQNRALYEGASFT